MEFVVAFGAKPFYGQWLCIISVVSVRLAFSLAFLTTFWSDNIAAFESLI